MIVWCDSDNFKIGRHPTEEIEIILFSVITLAEHINFLRILGRQSLLIYSSSLNHRTYQFRSFKLERKGIPP